MSLCFFLPFLFSNHACTLTFVLVLFFSFSLSLRLFCSEFRDYKSKAGGCLGIRRWLFIYLFVLRPLFFLPDLASLVMLFPRLHPFRWVRLVMFEDPKTGGGFNRQECRLSFLALNASLFFRQSDFIFSFSCISSAPFFSSHGPFYLSLDSLKCEGSGLNTS